MADFFVETITITIPIWAFWIFMALFTVHLVLHFMLLKVNRKLHQLERDQTGETPQGEQ